VDLSADIPEHAHRGIDDRHRRDPAPGQLAGDIVG